MPDALNEYQKEQVQKNLDLAHFLAREAWKRNKEEVELEEAVSVAYQGLIKAALRFDASLMSPETVENGKAFAAFARQKINGAILDWQRDIDHVQRTYRKWYKQLQKLGYVSYESSRKDIKAYAETMGLEHEKLALVIRAVENRNVSINYELSPENASQEGVKLGQVEGLVPSEESIESDAVGSQITEAMQQAYVRLPDFQKAIITLRFYGHDEFQSIAAEMNSSLAAVREAHAEAILTLHHAMARAATERA